MFRSLCFIFRQQSTNLYLLCLTVWPLCCCWSSARLWSSASGRCSRRSEPRASSSSRLWTSRSYCCCSSTLLFSSSQREPTPPRALSSSPCTEKGQATSRCCWWLFLKTWPRHEIYQPAYLQLCGLVEERGRQVVSVSLLQQGAHLLHLLLQRLLRLNRRLENTHAHSQRRRRTSWLHVKLVCLNTFSFLAATSTLPLHPAALCSLSYVSDTKIINTGAWTTGGWCLIAVVLVFLEFRSRTSSMLIVFYLTFIFTLNLYWSSFCSIIGKKLSSKGNL